MSEKERKKEFLKKLHHRYRVVILNDDTMEEKLSIQLSRFKVFMLAGTIVVLLVLATIYLIAFTPLKEYIPGYADFNTRKVLRELSLRADTLERQLRQKDLYIMNIRHITEGRDLIEEIPDTVGDPDAFDIDELPRSREDSILRAEMELAASFNQTFGRNNERQAVIEAGRFTFFPPLTGMISSHFDPSEGHYGVDIVADRDEIIKSTLDGTVIFSTWTLATGYTIGIQHDNNIVSIYKHNSSLLKQEGSLVEAGDPIAIIGDTGLYSTGTHLHFELWFNGIPVNPAEYISFQ